MDTSNEDSRPHKRVKIEEDNTVSQHNSKPPTTSDDNMKEIEVGINTWMDSSRPVFHGILKKRYTDFLVNEVLLDGTVAHLHSLSAKPSSDSKIAASTTISRAPDRDDGHKGSGKDQSAENTVNSGIGGLVRQDEGHVKSGGAQISEEDQAKLVEHFSEETVQELISLYQSILESPEKKSREHPIVRTSFTSDRSVRPLIHGDIRRIFQSKIDSATDNDGVLVLTAASRGPRGRGGDQQPKGRGLSWKERGGDHVHFNLYKENKDTMEVVSFLARSLKVAPKAFNFAGTKDRRGVTVQRVSAYRVEVNRLAGMNRSLRYAAIGDFTYEKHGLELGELNGNEFVITLRECRLGADWDQLPEDQKLETAKEYLSQSLDQLRNQGFLNHYGLQRFGSFMSRTDTVGLKILQGDFKGAVDAILQFSDVALEAAKSGDTSTLVGQDDRARAEGINHFNTTGNLNEALDKLPRKFSAESSLIRYLGRQRTDYLGALLSIPRNLRLMYVHAYQSLIFNLAIGERWKLFGNRVVEGDLILMHEHKDKEAQAQADQDVDADGEVIIQPGEEDRANDPDTMFDRARALTASEAESGAYSIFDIVLPLPGFDVEYPANALGQWYKTFMASEEGGGLDPHNMRRKQKDFSLSGSYRKVMARIGETYSVEVHSYADDDKQFVKTDMDLIKESKAQNGGTSARASRDATTTAKDENATENGKTNGAGEEEAEAEDKPYKIAAVLRFQLGSSQYATMALRDLSRGGVQAYKADFTGGR
ncbi:hypothetical protein LTR84_003228 [Exophiala bonariae]|uniref:TRUD domain-containing protein n=1 Tax=Exophiala bonariae TaxID=1690606 RepID=A0AAV9N8E9_9EURO|nr:hypothetical protein LTR84_003228 [Exophiala bonariae]